MDKTKIKYGTNGLNNNSVPNRSVINAAKISVYEWLISSKIILERYFVRKNDGVSFREMFLGKIIHLNTVAYFVNLSSVRQIPAEISFLNNNFKT